MLTVNGKVDAVLMNTKTYDKLLKASNLTRLLAVAEENIASKQTRPMLFFLKEFKRAHKVSG